jgi:hypothetical protein
MKKFTWAESWRGWVGFAVWCFFAYIAYYAIAHPDYPQSQDVAATSLVINLLAVPALIITWLRAEQKTSR